MCSFQTEHCPSSGQGDLNQSEAGGRHSVRPSRADTAGQWETWQDSCEDGPCRIWPGGLKHLQVVRRPLRPSCAGVNR